MAPRLRLLDIACFERLVPFTHAFRFGAVSVTAAPQAFVCVTVEVEGHGIATGAAAEMMMPKWFDKNPAKSPADTIDDLRAGLTRAAAVYRDARGFDTAFGHHARTVGATAQDAAPALVRGYGPAVIDKAILDALFKALGVDAATGLRRNLPGLDARLTPDIEAGRIDDFLAGLAPRAEVALRWTVGLGDDLAELPGEIARSSLHYLKLKLGGDVARDRARLAEIAGIMARAGTITGVTLDANEQYDLPGLAALVEALTSDAALAPLRERLMYVEQPLDRATTLAHDLGDVAEGMAFIIDEADGTYDAFPEAVARGYRGVSSKACKGLYKSLLNAVRARALNEAVGRPGHYFLSGEDLTCQAGLGVQQDTALVTLLGLGHVERNGHHYVDGFGPAPAEEAEAFATAHPDLYEERDGRLQLATGSGALATRSLFRVPGLAGGAEPIWGSLARLTSQSILEGQTS
ncbi:enolase [Chelatococcus daeguensis]|uniref:hypothetical protein n=1 Tax=Chelatococcus daeguensis TaxID=444444 RepID=UPI0007AB891F|nr:hypothetical protein [Chelatococcus daeguensis]KZE29401.1 enolase [Chelatococcus daeguensis]